MNAARVMKQAPTLIMVGFLGYTLFAMESGMPGAAETQAEVQRSLDRMVKEVLAEGNTAAKSLEGKLRDPFWIAPPPVSTQAVAAIEAAASPQTDDIAEIVRGMSLDATFLQGKDQLAVIDGRIYSRGQRIPLSGDDATPARSLQVLAVTRTGVLLKADNRHYNLGYPEQLGKKREEDDRSASADQRALSEIDAGGQTEMFQRLLNSPLGAMGRGLIGNPTSRGSAKGASAKARGRRSTDPNPRGPGSGGP